MKSDKLTQYKLEFSEEAYNDIVNIQNYSYTNLGDAQSQKYATQLDEVFQFLMKFPMSWHTREDIPKEYRAWVVAEHMVIYRVIAQVIYIVRVLHARMNFRFHF